ncbi:golgin_subfamily B member 1-like [Hexamita inflata]|uniref:Golgin subfamily B member 1-like n=1 Tax=Hexamita inflata TaxID=28002 RepID=A0AA86Q5C8_9EUKA|nr:golgin subfamily B member 1-like [Hexamita inflata]
MKQYQDTTKLKVNRIYQGDNVIDLSSPSKILFSNDSGSQRFINPATGDNDFKLDLTQLEGITIQEMTIKKFWSDVMYVNGTNIGLNLNDLIYKSQQYRIELNSLWELINSQKVKISNLESEFTDQHIWNDNILKQLLDVDTFIEQQKADNSLMQQVVQNINTINLKQSEDLTLIQQILVNIDEVNKKQTEKINAVKDLNDEHEERLNVIGPCVHKINNDYVTHSEITGFASNSAVTALSVSVGLLQSQCIVMDAGIAAAQSTATAAAATSTANSGLITTLQTQVTKLEGENALLTSDMTEIKAEQTTIKVDAAKVAADLKKFEIGQGITDASLQAQITDLGIKKADKETTYTKQEVDAFLVTQSDTNTQLTGGILQLGSTKADQVTTYTKTDIDNKLSLKANVVDVYTKTSMDGKLGLKANAADVYTKTQMDTSLALKSDKTYVDTGFNLYGSQLTTLKNRADNVDILNTTQNTNITNLQNGQTTLNNGMNTAFSRLQVIDNLNTQQNTSIVSLQTDNTTNKTDIGNLKTNDLKQDADISALKTSDTKQNTDIETLKTRCTDIETVNTSQDAIIGIHTGNFGQINDNFTEVWGRLDKIEQTDLTGVIGRLNQIDENLGDTMTSTYYLLQENTKNKENITALQNDNTTNKTNITTTQTNITSLTSRMNEQDQTNLTFGGKITTLQTDNTKNKNDIFNINNNVITIGNSVQAINTRTTNLETFVYNFQTQGTGWYKIGNLLFCSGYITTPGASQSATVSFPVVFKTITSQQATIVASLGNGGGGVDSCYISTTLTSVTVRHDYTSSSKTGNYHSWKVEGTWQ